MDILPLYMRTMPEEFYMEFMKERKGVSNFVETHFRTEFDTILKMVQAYISQNYQNKVIMWVGGSRSWNAAYNCWYGNITLSEIEKNSIVPGNYDIFLLSNDPQAHQSVLCLLTNLLENYISVFNQSKLESDYSLTKKFGNIKLSAKKDISLSSPVERYTNKECYINYPKDKGTCTLFPCQSIQLLIRSKSTGAKKRKSKAIQSEEVNLFRESVSLIESGELPQIVKPKLLFYCESFVIPGMDINLFRKNLVFSSCGTTDFQINYLNPKGLLFFSEFIKTPRREKGLNVDAFRKNLLVRTITATESPFIAYKMVLEEYLRLFESTTLLDKYLVGDLIQEMLKHAGIDMTTLIQTEFVKLMRPYVNSFLAVFSDEITKTFKKPKSMFLMLVGGDAMRRYDLNITNTSDFDTKFFVDPDYLQPAKITTRTAQEKLTKHKKLQRFVVEQMSQFVTFLIGNKDKILTTQDIKLVNLADFNATYNFFSGGLQFRLRLIDKNPDLPVELYSVDFRTEVQCQFVINGKVYRLPISIDIPFLDIVITSNAGIERSTAIGESVSRVIPVASLDYILSDFEKTYTTPSLAASRYWNSKKQKDEYRYKILKGIQSTQSTQTSRSKTQITPPVEMMEIENGVYSDILDVTAEPNVWKDFTSVTNIARKQIYTERFLDVIQYNRNAGTVKHKMSFYNVSSIQKILKLDIPNPMPKPM